MYSYLDTKIYNEDCGNAATGSWTQKGRNQMMDARLGPWNLIMEALHVRMH